MEESIYKLIKKGYRETRHSFRKDRPLFFSYFIHLIMRIVTMPLIIIYPIFALSSIKISEDAINEHTFSIEKSFEYSDQPKKYINTLKYLMISVLTLIIGLALIASVTYGFMHIGMMLDELTIYRTQYITTTFFSIGVFIGFIYLVRHSLYYAPGIYLIAKENLTTSEALVKSKQIMKTSGKTKLLVITIFSILRTAVLVGLVILSRYIMDEYFLDVVMDVITILLIIIAVLRLPRITLSYEVSIYVLFSNIVGKYNTNNGINVSNDLDKDVKESLELLNSLFENSLDPKNN